MRADMAKVIVERPRRNRAGAYPRGKLKAEACDLDSAPTRESMGRGYATKLQRRPQRDPPDGAVVIHPAA